MRFLLFLTLLAAPALAQDELRITEWMYKGTNGEFLELTNVGLAAVDLTGWSFDDKSDMPGTVDLSPLGVVAPGESVIITEADATQFAADWGLVGVGVLGGNALANLGRNDTLHVYDALMVVHDVLTYGDQDLVGSPRTDAVSASVCDEAIGGDFAWSWRLASIGDAQGSVTSVVG